MPEAFGIQAQGDVLAQYVIEAIVIESEGIRCPSPGVVEHKMSNRMVALWTDQDAPGFRRSAC